MSSESEDYSDDDRIERLTERIKHLEEESQRTRQWRENVEGLLQQFAEGAISRRAFLTALGATGVGAYAIGTARAAPSYGSSSGQVGTSSKPLTKVVTDDLRVQDITADNSITTGQLQYDQGLTVEEDDNSPINSSGLQSHTLTLAGSYDLVWMRVRDFTNNSGSTQALQVRVNGDSGSNYRYTSAGGTETTSATEWKIGDAADGKTISGSFEINERFGGLGLDGPIGSGAGANVILTGLNSSVSQPLDSITFRGGSGNVAIDARVVGVTL